MQLLLKGVAADEAYVSERRWERQVLDACPHHPLGGCGLRFLGSYPRVWPVGCRVPRFLCPATGTTISLLPQSLAAGVSGSLEAIEQVADVVEREGVSAAVERFHPAEAEGAIGLAGSIRSVRRRARWVRSVLLAVVTLMAAQFEGVPATLAGLRAALGVDQVLVELRLVAIEVVEELRGPVGLRARART